MGKIGYVLAFIGIVAAAYALTLHPTETTMGGPSLMVRPRAASGIMDAPDVGTKQQMIWTASLVVVSLGVILVIADQFMSYLQKRFPLAPSNGEDFEK